MDEREKILAELKDFAERPNVDISDVEKIKIEIKGLRVLLQSLEELLKIMEAENEVS